MPAIQNLTSLKSKLEKLANKHRQEGTNSVVIGYTANYATYVHEIPARHKPGKQMKFLEQPARKLSPILGGLIAESLGKGVKLLPSLYLAGLRLQRESQAIVPVDLGNLRASAFTAKEDELEAIIAESEAKLAKRFKKQKVRFEKQKLAKLKRVKREAKRAAKATTKTWKKSFKQRRKGR